VVNAFIETIWQASWTDTMTRMGFVIGAPVNGFNVNAITRRFKERLVCLTYWQWGKGGYALRNKTWGKKAVLITSSAMPAIMGRFFTGAPRALRVIAETMGEKPVASLFAGLSAQKQKTDVSDNLLRKARKAGHKLAAFEHACGTLFQQLRRTFSLSDNSTTSSVIFLTSIHRII
jgi:hypothetical protein